MIFLRCPLVRVASVPDLRPEVLLRDVTHPETAISGAAPCPRGRFSPACIQTADRDRAPRACATATQPIIIVLAMAALIAAAAMATPTFLTVENLLVVVRAASITGILALGMSYITYIVQSRRPVRFPDPLGLRFRLADAG